MSLVIGLAWCGVSLGQNNADRIVHDSEYYILEAQNGKVWAVEDGELDIKLAELRQKYGTPPNIIHYMWDDQPPMSFGDPIYQKIRGCDTPNLNTERCESPLRFFLSVGRPDPRPAVM